MHFDMSPTISPVSVRFGHVMSPPPCCAVRSDVCPAHYLKGKRLPCSFNRLTITSYGRTLEILINDMVLTSGVDVMCSSEEFDLESGEFQYTMIAAIDADEIVYYTESPLRKSEITQQHITTTLRPLRDEDIFPKWPPPCPSGSTTLTRAPLDHPSTSSFFIKRPNLSQYDVFKRHNVVHLIGRSLLQEALNMEFLSKHPHPHIIRYYGCRYQRGYVTGMVLDRYSSNLEDYIKNRTGTINAGVFIRALESAIRHIHSLGWAHNDLNPTNVLIDESDPSGGLPILIDFGSACKIGGLLGTSRGTSGWIDGRMEDYTISRSEHDISALEKIRVWLGTADVGENDKDRLC